MLRRLGWLGVAAVMASCGGQARHAPRRAVAAGASGQGGAGGRAGTSGACGECGGLRGGGAGNATNGGAPAEAGSGDNAGASGETADAGGNSTGQSGAPADVAGEAGVGSVNRAGTGGAQATGGAVGQAGASEGGAAGETATDPTGLRIDKVAIYQAVEVTLAKNGSDVAYSTPIIADREALVRVWLAPGAAWQPREVEGELAIDNGTASRTATVVAPVNAASVDLDLGSTLTFTLRASEVSSMTTLSLTLSDEALRTPLDRWPAHGQHALNTSSSRGPFTVTLVPVAVNGYTPVLDTPTVSRFERYLSRVYPASSVEMSVHAPISLNFELAGDGTGWDDALDALYAARDADAPAPNVYYYGVLTPGASFSDYCGDDCVVGLSTVATRTDEGYRGAIGTGFFESNADTFSQETMAHELGHALGREHAPCGHPDAVDPRYPYPYGQIGVLGYDGRNLLDPDDYKDEMTYCVPVWISDYTWTGIFSRINYVNGLAGAARVRSTSSPPLRVRTLALGPNGQAHWGSERAPASAPDGEPTNVELLDRSGAVLGVVTAPFARFDHLTGGFLSVPSAALARPGVTSVRVGGTTLALP